MVYQEVQPFCMRERYEPILVAESTYIRVVTPRRDKSCGRVEDKFGLRTWTINLRTWIFEFTCLVFKTTCIDRGKPLWEGAFFFTGMVLFPPLDKRNTRDKAKGLCINSERYIGGLGVRCLSTLNRGQDYRQQSHIGQPADQYRFIPPSPEMDFRLRKVSHKESPRVV